MSTILMLPILVFFATGIVLILLGVFSLFKKRVAIASLNTKYWTLSPLIKAFTPGSSSRVSTTLTGTKKYIFAVCMILLGMMAFIACWQLYVLSTLVTG